MISRVLAGKVPALRRLPAVDAIEEVIGRSAEMGRPIFFSHGTGGIQTASTLAAIEVLPFVARKCVQLGQKIFLPTGSHQAYLVLLEVLREAYVAEGKPELYDANDVVYLSSVARAYSSGCMSIMLQNNVGGSIMLGGYHHAGLMLVEMSNQVGAISVGGTTSTSQLPWFVAGCNYTLIGEECYALGAYVSEKPMSVGTVVAQDVLKVSLIIIIVIGVLLMQVGFEFSNWFHL